MALAHDISGDAKYLTGAVAAMDYVLGRNPNGLSFVTGYGARAFQNAHHRFWASAYSASFPAMPPGVLAEGANQMLDGVPTVDSLRGCAPMKCWRDDENIPSMTEPAVNLNAPLAWLAAWLQEMGTNPPSGHLGVPGGTGGTGGAGAGGAGAGGAGGASATGSGGASGTGTGGGPGADAGAGSGAGGAGAPGAGGGKGGGCGCALGAPLATAPASTAAVACALALLLLRRRRGR